MAKAGRGADQFMVRLPEGMRDRIAAAAEKNGRSMNSEIVRVLELAFPPPISLEQKLNELSLMLTALAEVQGAEHALDALTVQISEVIESIDKGLAIDVDDETRAKIKRWRNLIKSARTPHKRLVEERYKGDKGDK